MTNFSIFAVTATAALCLSACASPTNPPMDTGERISQRGGDISGYGDAWTAGQNDVKRGESLIEKSNKASNNAQKKLLDAQAEVTKAEERIRTAEKDRTDGQRLIADGTTQMQRAEADYSIIRSGPSANPDSTNY